VLWISLRKLLELHNIQLIWSSSEFTVQLVCRLTYNIRWGLVYVDRVELNTNCVLLAKIHDLSTPS